MKIINIESRKILNSAGSWTIETALQLESGVIAVASVAGGISKGEREVTTLPADEAVQKVDILAEDLLDREFKTQKDFDDFLIEKDGTEDKSFLGGNTILSLSLAFCRASAMEKDMQLYEYIHTLLNPDIPLADITFKSPKFMVLIFEGGLHGSGKATIQEFMPIVKDIDRAVEIYSAAKKKLHSMNISTNVGAEGAFSPEHLDNEGILDLAKSLLKEDEQIALDVAAASFEELKADLPDYEKIITNYPIATIEDPHTENDWTAWENFYRTYRADVTVITDDLTTTNPNTLREAIKRQAGNGIIIKPNQIGTVSEVLETVALAQNHNWNIVVSHRGTETNDDFIADLAFGIQADYVKFGGIARGERVAKYNRVLEIIKMI